MTDLSNLRIFACTSPINMNLSFDRLMGLAQGVFDQDPLSGHLFLFFNRPRNRIKILFWDGDGYALYYKQLARGSFEFPEPPDETSASVEIRASELSMLLDGIELKGRRRRPRYQRAAG